MEEKEKKVQEMQLLEQGLQNVFLQKQSFQMELNEINSSLEELEKSGDEVFKIVGQLMIKTDKEAMKKEMLDKKKLIELRVKSFEDQEETLSKKLESLRKEVIGK